MKNKKKITILALSLIAVFAAAMTFAYFTDQSDEVKNTFTMGNVEILLDEALVVPTTGPSGTTWAVDEEADRVLSNTYDNIYPGAILPKDPMVENTGSNPAYIRAKVTFTKHAELAAAIPDPKTILGTLGAGWSYFGVDGSTYEFRFANVLPAGGITNPLFTQVTIPASLNSAEMESISGFQINVIAEAIQSQGFANVTEAFAAYDAP
ncbi:SipW-dependent-type signal peptide-containing protein [Proteiniclasticum ruminis]|uniref:SipW-cognate class signal peptide n=1 Tax=Proteiniclasticum ruminis TaxID=398199 RepID=A0A1I5BTJ1_9CLOT|nr:SipW-dependent-type signal peptide-containing protein [Proteiniclasticum ruminis]SFN78030.1 SipW-cognate class signal peptide [Proteiniclasticum ruminis]